VALWNIYQEIQINNLRAQQRGAEVAHRGRIENAQDAIWTLEDRIERLLLLTDAMWELLSERAGVTDEELAAKVHEVDSRGDGARDGRRARSIRRCGSCQAAIEHGRATCTFCGAPAPGATPIDAV
jgi:hypothetical protein